MRGEVKLVAGFIVLALLWFIVDAEVAAWKDWWERQTAIVQSLTKLAVMIAGGSVLLCSWCAFRSFDTSASRTEIELTMSVFKALMPWLVVVFLVLLFIIGFLSKQSELFKAGGGWMELMR